MRQAQTGHSDTIQNSVAIPRKVAYCNCLNIWDTIKCGMVAHIKCKGSHQGQKFLTMLRFVIRVKYFSTTPGSVTVPQKRRRWERGGTGSAFTNISRPKGEPSPSEQTLISINGRQQTRIVLRAHVCPYTHTQCD